MFFQAILRCSFSAAPEHRAHLAKLTDLLPSYILNVFTFPKWAMTSDITQHIILPQRTNNFLCISMSTDHHEATQKVLVFKAKAANRGLPSLSICLSPDHQVG